MSTIMPSSLSNGRYQLGELIGRGGMAEVRQATDTRLGRTVAVKIMRSDLANDEIFLSRFRREAHSVAQMNNPNIVNIYDSGEENVVDENGHGERLPYLVMEYVKGQTLRDIIHANGALSQRDAAQVMIGVLNALEYSHRMGIIHRDIKPGNIMISDQGIVKVMDFGIARALDDSAATMTQSQGVVGTAQYLSPEQARGETVDMRSDLYSAGCVLYEMLTGRPPFTGDSAVAIAYQHVSEVATPPSSTVPGLPRMWDQICAKAMAKDRQNRYATATEFRNDIYTFMNGGVPTAAAFNPLTDLASLKERREAEQNTAATEAMTSGETTATQAFSPFGDEFSSVATPESEENHSRVGAREQATRTKRRKRIIIASVVAGVLILAAIIGVLAATGVIGGKSDTVTVPTFTTATTQDAAKARLKALGLTAKVKLESSSTEAKGTFLRQNPKGGSTVKKGSTVTVWFSSGPKSVKVPSVVGETQDEARQTLKAAGFMVGSSTQTEDSATVEKDHVTRTDPDAGSYARQGSTILLYVSSGMTSVPENLVGETKASVLSTLNDIGFSTNVEQEYSDSVAKGSVTRTDPTSGTSVEQGSTITVYVSQGKEQVTVPSGITLGTTTYAEAKSLLESAGLTVTTTGSTKSSNSDIVTSMSPAAGSTIDKGGTVTLTLQSATTTVPSGITLGTTTYADAKQILENAGLTVTTSGSATPADNDIVTSMSPAAGSTIDKGGTVTLTLQSATDSSQSTGNQ
ncbi:Stk1 family PASTA domain-containing Ser/Thr kinase [uncultured Bifidobacterium sp.]|uniref:Stk1 family PASTA domain-containing Ser/Thr kinase n=1 Tax=uncultured Bifidobacterium sp. TaxID=165187 RepID=UPI0028DCCC52|nr:Stk1 family PASTA domain-containing Ser/Thr kinase [uncultured Bifidobacterium sp.]